MSSKTNDKAMREAAVKMHAKLQLIDELIKELDERRGFLKKQLDELEGAQKPPGQESQTPTPATRKQKDYIKDLLKKNPDFKIYKSLDELSREEASAIIDRLLSRKQKK